MRFELIDRAKKNFPVRRLCRVLDVSESGHFACIGWSVSDRLHHNSALAALRGAFAIRPEPGLICHSGRGSQY